MYSIVNKPTGFFCPDPSNPRKEFPEEELRPLGESVKKKQHVPVIARTSGMIVDGERRIRAAKLVGVTHLDAILIDDDTPHWEIKEIQLITALQRADLKPYEVFCGFQDWLKARQGATAKELAGAIDRSEATVSKTLSLSRCTSAVQEAAKEGKIGLKDWHTISQAAAEHQADMLRALLSGTSLEKVKQMGRKRGDSVRTARVKCEMGSGVCVTLAGIGQGLTLDDVIQTLTELLKAAKKANEDGLDSKTFSAVMRDKAKAG